MAWVAPVIAGVGAIYNAYQQHKTNKQQTELANTSVQRRQADLSAAGVNPALAYMNGAQGAQTPNLDAVEFDPNVGSEVQNAYTASTQRTLAKMQAANLAAQNSAIVAQTTNTEAATRKTNAEAMEIESRIPYSSLDAQNRSSILDHQLLLLAQQVSSATSQADIDWDKREISRLTREEQTALIPLQRQYQQLVNLGLSLGKTQQEIDKQFAEQHGMQMKMLDLIKAGGDAAGKFIPNPFRRR